MIMKYEWKHFWGSFEKKAQAIFGKPKEKRGSIDSLDDQRHKKAVEELMRS